ncbi:MAG: hypothetical protein Q9191_005861 [Dirinaria sp. TL-2023a]
MSFAAVNDPAHAPSQDAQLQPATSQPKPKYKSYKKKFLKLKHQFDKAVFESTASYEEEQKLIKTAKRLRESNDQLLDLLLHKNDSPKLPLHLQYDIRSPPPDTDSVPSLEPDQTPPPQPLIKAEEEADTDIPDDASSPTRRPKSLSILTRSLPHSTLPHVSSENLLPDDLDSDEPIGYYSPTHESAYLAQLDISLGLTPGVEPPKPTPLGPRIADREKERLKQNELHNPVSAYNWLRKNQPQVFLQDNEGGEKPERATKNTGAAAAKASPKPAKGSRRSAAKKEKEEQQEVVLDDEGYVIGGPGFEDVPPATGGRGKRKREGDEAYRPKGGSSRPTKRKKRASAEKERGSGTPVSKQEGP